jgi:sortase A
MRASCAVAAVLAGLLSACGTSEGEVTVGASVATSTTVVASPTTLTPVTAPPTTVAPTTVAPTTVAPSTTTATTEPPTTTIPPALPVPAEIPANPRAKEPIVEIGSIEIPKIGVAKQMFSGVTLTVLDNGPGHWPGTALPGQMGNVVVAGHRTSHDRPFRNIDQLVAGDEVIFTTPDGRFVYHVTGVRVVEPTAVEIIDQTPAFTGTLFACHPPGSTRQRIVVDLALAA